MTAAPLEIDIFAPGAAETAVLVSMRLTGLMLIAPVFSARTIPVMVRTALIVVLTIVLYSLAWQEHSAIPELSILSALTEVLIGVGIGFGAALVVGAAEAAGDLLSIQIGLSGAALLDPMTQRSMPILANFLSLMTVTILLALNGHLIMITALGNSFSVMPVGVPIDMTTGIGTMISQAGVLFVIGLRFAAPVVAIVMIGNTALAVLSRVAPQLNVLAVAFPLQIGLGLLALAIAIPFIATFFADWPSLYNQQLGDLVRSFRIGTP